MKHNSHKFARQFHPQLITAFADLLIWVVVKTHQAESCALEKLGRAKIRLMCFEYKWQTKKGDNGCFSVISTSKTAQQEQRLVQEKISLWICLWWFFGQQFLKAWSETPHTKKCKCQCCRKMEIVFLLKRFPNSCLFFLARQMLLFPFVKTGWVNYLLYCFILLNFALLLRFQRVSKKTAKCIYRCSFIVAHGLLW